MNVAFVGSLDRGFAVIEWCKKNDASLDNFNDKKIEKLVDPLLSRPYQHIILDIEHLVTPYPEIAETVGKIKAASNVSITILASGYSPNSDVVTALLNIGIRNFVTATSLGEMTDQLGKCLAGYYKEHPLEVFPTMPEKPVLAPSGAGSRRQITVAFCGSMSRIGTTTQALQAVKFLSLHNLKTCYIEMNDSGFIKDLMVIYGNIQHDRMMGCVTYSGVDLYYDRTKISEILKLDYDAYIFDFGNLSIESFNFVSFLERTIRCVIGGTKPQEIVSMRKTLDLLFSQPDINYIFSFSDPGEHQDILDLMDERKDHTFFATYNPDPFSYSSQNNSYFEKIFESILPAPETAQPAEKKKFSLFRRKK